MTSITYNVVKLDGNILTTTREKLLGFQPENWLHKISFTNVHILPKWGDCVMKPNTKDSTYTVAKPYTRENGVVYFSILFNGTGDLMEDFVAGIKICIFFNKMNILIDISDLPEKQLIYDNIGKIKTMTKFDTMTFHDPQFLK